MDYTDRKNNNIFNQFAPALLRLSIGLFFLLIGLDQIGSLGIFAATVANVDFAKNYMPEWLVKFYGYLLPPIEILFGTLTIVGLLTRVSSFVLCLAMISILIADPHTITSNFAYPFNKDYIVLAATMSLVFTGGGIISIDYLFDRKKRKYY